MKEFPIPRGCQCLHNHKGVMIHKLEMIIYLIKKKTNNFSFNMKLMNKNIK